MPTKQPAHTTARHPVLPSLEPADPFVGFMQAARMIGVSDFILNRFVADGRMPTPTRHNENGRRYFRLTQITAFIEARDGKPKRGR